ncbi:glycosyltransferase family 39 protein [soil metagenome]
MRRYGLNTKVVAVALVLTVTRLVAARWIHLTEDEAYYRLWAQHLQFGYYDHPPMVAWWIRAGVTAVGDNPLGVRLLAILATGIATWLVADLARALGVSPRTALRAAVWYNATITIGVGGILATPDAPATLFWIACLWALAKTMSDGASAWWLAAGLAAGLGAISKYSALFLAPGVLLWLGLTLDGRRTLRTPWHWLADVIAAALFATNLAWNAGHEWITFSKQFGRLAPSGFSPAYLGDLLIGQFVLLNPLIAVYAVRGLWQGWRERATGTAHLLLPVATTAPFAAYLLLHSLHDRVQGHWPVPLFAALVICAAVAVERASDGRVARMVRGTAIGAGFGLSALALAYMAAPQSRGLGTFDPILALRGWRQFSVEVDRLRQQSGAQWVGTVGYGALAQLSAERLIKAPLIQIYERGRYRQAPPSRADLARPGLVVDLARRLTSQDLDRCFGQVRALGDLDRGASGGGPAARYRTYLVSQPRVDVLAEGCPEDPARRRGRR